MRFALGFAAVIAVGCSDAASPGDDCAGIIRASLARSKPALAAEAGKDLEVAQAVMLVTDVMAERCREDRWSAEALACIKASTSKEGFQACQQEHLTEPQRQRLLHAVATTTGPGEVSAAAPMLARMAELRDRMCACTDRACVSTVTNEMSDWGRTLAGASGKLRGPEEKLARRIGEDAAACAARDLPPRP